MKKKIVRKICFLGDDEEVKIISRNIPHAKLYVLNTKGKLIVKDVPYKTIKSVSKN